MQNIQTWEEISLAAWPTLDSFEYDGWIVRTSGGYTKRSNSVNPIQPGGKDVDEKIAHCENHFQARKLPVIFKMTEEVVYPSNLDDILEEKGYREDSPTSVMTIDLSGCAMQTSCSVSIEASGDAWLDAYQRFSGLSGKNKELFRRMLQNHRLLMAFLLLTHADRTAGCGLSILYENTAGFFDIAVEENQRRKGFGREIMHGLMAWAKIKGAHTGYLQVECDNEPAIRLYETIGFEEEYQYWYRIKGGAP